MNDMLSPNKMVEATRLTRAGRLTEATALLQRMLRAERPPDMTIGTTSDIVSTGREPPIIDAMAKSEGHGSSAVFARQNQQSTGWPAVRKHGHNRSAAHAPQVERFAPGRMSRLRARITRLGAAGPSIHAGHRAGWWKVH
jgi:hypothetical protein